MLIGSKTVFGKSPVPAVALKDDRPVEGSLYELDLFPKLLARLIDVGFELLEKRRLPDQIIERRHEKRAGLSMSVKPCAVLIDVSAQVNDASGIACRHIGMHIGPLSRFVCDAKQHAVGKADEASLFVDSLDDRRVITVEIHAVIDGASDRTLRWFPRAKSRGNSALANRLRVRQEVVEYLDQPP